MDGVFLTSLDYGDIMMVFSDCQRERLSEDGRHPSEKQIAEMRQDMIDIMTEIDRYIQKGLTFAFLLDVNSDWHYAGREVSFRQLHNPGRFFH